MKPAPTDTRTSLIGSVYETRNKKQEKSENQKIWKIRISKKSESQKWSKLATETSFGSTCKIVLIITDDFTDALIVQKREYNYVLYY